MRFENKVAIVTGSGKGLGFAYAKALAKEGAKVIIAEYSESLGEKAAKELNDQGYEAVFIKCDVSNEANVKDVVGFTVDKYGKIDILINNAQATDPSTLPAVFEDTTIALFRKEWETGAFGTFLFIKYCLPYMKKQNYGKIVNVASATGIKGIPTYAAMGSEKEAIRGMTRVCANENGRFGITCNTICPAAFTEAAKQWKEAAPKDYEAAVSLQSIPRMGDPDTDVAPVVMFLVSDESKYVTGQTIGCDGGTTML